MTDPTIPTFGDVPRVHGKEVQQAGIASERGVQPARRGESEPEQSSHMSFS